MPICLSLDSELNSDNILNIKQLSAVEVLDSIPVLQVSWNLASVSTRHTNLRCKAVVVACQQALNERNRMDLRRNCLEVRLLHV